MSPLIIAQKMKKIWAFLLIVFPLNGFSQEGGFKMLRYEEDYGFYKNDTLANWYQKLKFSPVSANKNSYFSFGGDIRYQYFWFENEDWGDAPEDRDGFVLTRYLGHVDAHFGENFRAFAQLQTSLASGKESGISPVDENQLDLHQGFLEWTFFNKNQQSFFARIGRQELLYGSQRLISVREGPNSRQAFDAIKGHFQNTRFQSDVFFSYTVTPKNKIFDDPFFKGNKLWGFYTMIHNCSIFQNIDLYYLGIKKAESSFNDLIANELRHSVGTRIWKKSGNWQYDFEGVYQWGKFGENNIAAWTISSNTAYLFSAKSPLKLGLKTEMISGDKWKEDGELNTFNPLFPRGAYFGLAALIGPSNLFDLHPYFEWELPSHLTLQFDYDVFWRMSKNDGVYGPNTRMIYPSNHSDLRHIGQQLGSAVVYSPNPFLEFEIELTWFKTGRYLAEVSAGKNILMAGTTLQLKF
jgi:Alginate export